MKLNKQSGQVLIGTAVAMVVLAGFAGLAIDMGTLRYQKRLQQTAADGAAIAGASNLGYNAGSGVLPAAQTSATANGFTDAGGQNLSNCADGAAIGTICVQVLNPPQDVTFNGGTILGGPHSSNGNYVEVLVAEVHPTYFMNIFGIASKTIFARAVATNLGGNTKNTGCLYTLGGPLNAIEGVNINGSVIVNATTCGIVDNGNFNTKGNKLIVNAGTFGIAGDVNASGPGGSVTCVQTPTLACPTPNTPASGDPLAKLVPPCSPCTGGSAVTVNSNTTLSPGTYSSISIGPATVTFSPGLYIIDCAAGCNVSSNPGLQVGANSTIQGTGVTFYLTNGATVGMTGTPGVQLTAPDNSGQYPGVLFYQDPADTNGPSFGGNSSSFYDGVLYFPKSQITFFGNNNSIAVAMVVAEALAFSGNPTVNLQGAAGLPSGVNLVTNAVLVE
jgi:Putative Flp pilus-assembly TadE/G-like